MSDAEQAGFDELVSLTTQLALSQQETAVLGKHLANAKDREQELHRTLDASVAELFTQRHGLRVLVGAAKQCFDAATYEPLDTAFICRKRLNEVRSLLAEALSIELPAAPTAAQ